jgi:hypothetical protein
MEPAAATFKMGSDPFRNLLHPKVDSGSSIPQVWDYN